MGNNNGVEARQREELRNQRDREAADVSGKPLLTVMIAGWREESTRAQEPLESNEGDDQDHTYGCGSEHIRLISGQLDHISEVRH